jgi:non-specific serine/threonine protein kinase
MAAQHAAPHTLPPQLTSFIGREDEIAHARDLLPGTRLLTLTGPGGSGKTRLAIAIAEGVQDVFADGVVFVSLAPMTDPSLVSSSIAEAMRAALSPDRPPIDQLVDMFSTLNVLLVLDNFEQVVAAAPLVSDLLVRCPLLTILVTSRVPLHLSAEQVFLVPPLALPNAGGRLVLAEVERNAAVALFVVRARAHDPMFRITDGNAAAVTDICRHLDGLPLAIELAAARIGFFSPRELAGRIERRLSALARGPLDAPRRQQTIRDAIAWSYDLLTVEQRVVFARLSVFAGGWTLDAAETVASEPGVDVVEMLAALNDQNLVYQTTKPDGTTRYGMLETIREYGLERLIERGDEVAHARHAAYFTTIAERAVGSFDSSEHETWFRRFTTENHNFRAALAWSLDVDPVEALRLAGALESFWLTRGHLREGGDWLEAALARGADAPPAIRANALMGAGELACWQGDHEQSNHWLEQALDLYLQLGDDLGVRQSTFCLARTAHFQGEYDRADDLYQQVTPLHRMRGDWSGVTGATGNRGLVVALQGDLELATALVEEALRLCYEHGLSAQPAIWLTSLGELTLRRGDVARARGLIREGMQRIAASLPGHVPNGLETSAALATAERDPERAARLYGAASRVRQRSGYATIASERASYEQALATVRSALGEERFADAWQDGASMSTDEAVAYALEEPAQPVEPVPPPSPHAILTPRESDVLRLIVEGASDREIAATLFISRYTVSRHVQNILNKLGLPSRTAAATYAVRNGLI